MKWSRLAFGFLVAGRLVLVGSVGADTYYWTGAATPPSSHMEDANWTHEATGQANRTVSGSGHLLEFRGQTTGALNLSYGTAFGAPTGNIYWLTTNQTAAVTLINRDSEPQDLRLLPHDNTFHLQAGSGPLTLGGAGGTIRLVFDGESDIFTYGVANQSSHPLTFSTNVVWAMSSCSTNRPEFKGTGPIVIDGSLIGSGGVRQLRKEGTGTLTLGGDNSERDFGGGVIPRRAGGARRE